MDTTGKLHGLNHLDM